MSKQDRPTFTADDPQAAAEAVAEIEQAPAADRGELMRKAEKLTAAAAKLLEQIEVETVDASKLTIDNEVRAALDEMNEVYVSNTLPEYAYAWIYRDPSNQLGGRFVRKMQALGWEVVRADMPEAEEHRDVNSYRVVADCLLMRIRLDKKMLLEKRDRLLREAQQAGIVSRVHDLAERVGSTVHEKLPGFVENEMASRSDMLRRQRALGAFHRMNAGGKVDRMLKTGTIPGVPVPGAGR